MNFKEKILNYKIRHAQPRQVSFPDMSRVKNVLVLYESDLVEKNIQMKQLFKELKQTGLTVVSWGYVDKKAASTAILLGSRVLAQQDLNVFGAPKKHLMQEIAHQQFDLLLDLTLRPVLPLRYVALEANVAFKVGRQTYEKPYIHDFLVKIDDCQDAAQLYDQMMYYLNQIHSND